MPVDCNIEHHDDHSDAIECSENSPLLSQYHSTTEGCYWAFGLIFGTAPLLSEWLYSHNTSLFVILQFLDSNLRGSGQVMFLDNPLSGLLVILALMTSGVWLGVCAIIGLSTSTIIAIMLEANEGTIQRGLFGYNGILVGCALGTFCKVEWITVIYVVTFAVFAVPVQLAFENILSGWQIPPYTMPFNLMLFIALLGAQEYKYIDLPIGATENFAEVLMDWDWHKLWKAWMLGISQVYLADHWISGIIITLAAVLCNPLYALFALIGSGIGIGIGFALGVNASEIYSGLWGYNAALASVAIFVHYKMCNTKGIVLCILCSVLSSLLFGAIRIAFSVWSIPAATLPFVLSAWVFALMIPKELVL